MILELDTHVLDETREIAIKAKSKMADAAESRKTTVTGLVTILSAGVLALIPADIRDTCLTAVQNSDNPAFVGGLLATGVALTIWGPSLKK